MTVYIETSVWFLLQKCWTYVLSQYRFSLMII